MEQDYLTIKDNVLLSYRAKNVDTLVVPEGVVAIKNVDRRYTYGLKKLSLPASFTTFYPEESQFPDIGEITVAAGNPKFKVVNNCLIDKTTDTLVFACNAFGAPIAIPPVKHIGNYAFSKRHYLSVDIPSSIKTIGDFAFANCKVNTTLTLHSGLLSIGNNAFKECYLRHTLTFPDTLQSIGDYAFDRSCQFDELNIPDSVKSIGKYAFNNCNLRIVRMGKGVTSFGGYTFNGCKKYINSSYGYNEQVHINIIIPEGVTKILPYAFSSSARSIMRIPKTVKEIGDYAFGMFWTVNYSGTKQQWEAIKKGKGFTSGVDVCCTDGRISIPSPSYF